MTPPSRQHWRQHSDGCWALRRCAKPHYQARSPCLAAGVHSAFACAHSAHGIAGDVHCRCFHVLQMTLWMQSRHRAPLHMRS